MTAKGRWHEACFWHLAMRCHLALFTVVLAGCARVGPGETSAPGDADVGIEEEAAPPLGPLPPSSVKEVALGAAHSCARLDDGSVWCWGINSGGQVGAEACTGWDCFMPATRVVGLPPVTQIAAGGGQTCALSTEGTVWCWGSAEYGALGIVATDRCRSSCILKPTPVPGLSDAREIALGDSFLCARTADGGVSCYGFDSSVDPPPPLRLAVPPAKGLAAGADHVCVLLIDGHVRCWGSNAWGQRGLGATGTYHRTPLDVVDLADVDRVFAGYLMSCAHTRSGEVRCWGIDISFELAAPSEELCYARWACSSRPLLAIGVSSTMVALGGYSDDTHGTPWSFNDRGHGCAVDADRTVRCWGWAWGVEVGADCPTGGCPKPVPGLHDAVHLALGARHACAATGDGRVWCWGENDGGQLGDGTRTRAVVPREVRFPPR